MNISVYIKGAFIFNIASLAFYSMTRLHFAGDDMQMLESGATITDFIYYNSIKMAACCGAISLSCLCIALNEEYNENLAIYAAKYLSYAISGILFTRVVFHLKEYDNIPDIEEVIDFAIVVLGAMKGVHGKGKLKILDRIWHTCSKYFKSHRTTS